MATKFGCRHVRVSVEKRHPVDENGSTTGKAEQTRAKKKPQARREKGRQNHNPVAADTARSTALFFPSSLGTPYYFGSPPLSCSHAFSSPSNGFGVAYQAMLYSPSPSSSLRPIIREQNKQASILKHAKALTLLSRAS